MTAVEMTKYFKSLLLFYLSLKELLTLNMLYISVLVAVF